MTGVRQSLGDGHGGYVRGIARARLECSDAALALE